MFLFPAIIAVFALQIQSLSRLLSHGTITTTNIFFFSLYFFFIINPNDTHTLTVTKKVYSIHYKYKVEEVVSTKYTLKMIKHSSSSR
jgi:hypothetical protein